MRNCLYIRGLVAIKTCTSLVHVAVVEKWLSLAEERGRISFLSYITLIGYCEKKWHELLMKEVESVCKKSAISD